MFATVLSSPATPPAILREILTHPEWRTGFCAAANEAWEMNELTSPFMRASQFPFERDFSESASLRAGIFDRAKRECRMSLAKKRGPMTEDWHTDAFLFAGSSTPSIRKITTEAASRLPYIRRAIGLTYSFVMEPSLEWYYLD